MDQSLTNSPAGNGFEPTITVFTPKGRPIVLPLNATLLDMAVVLHGDFVATARGGRRNGERIGILDRLRDRDKVEIEIGRTQRPLPHDWEAHVTPALKPKIRESFRSAYRRTLEQRGMIYLQRRLIEAGVWPLPAETKIHDIVSAVLEERPLISQRHIQVGSPVDNRELLIELGILESKMLRKLPVMQQLEETELEHFLLNAFLRCIQIEDAPHNGELETDRRIQMPAMKICACATDELAAMIGERREETVVWHHAKGTGRCIVPKTRRITLAPPSTQYLFLEGYDQVGIVAEVGLAFEIAGIDITEILAIALPNGGARVRVRMVPTSMERLEVLMRALHCIDGISGITGPDEKISRSERSHFPPRREAEPTRRRFVQPPYDVGPVIHHPERLYGRRQLTEQFEEYLDGMLDSAYGGSRSIFCHGPYKVGKSSLVSTVFGQLARARDDGTLWVRLDANPRESWRSYERRLMEHLVAELKSRQLLGGERHHGEWPTVAHLVRWIREEVQWSVLLGIDEVTSLFAETREESEAAEAAATLVELDRIRGTAIVYIGPDIESRRTLASLNRIVRLARKIEVRPLSSEHCAAILEARQTRHSISAHETVRARLFWETQGHPYWVQLLSERMWYGATGDTPTSRVRYSYPHIVSAIEVLTTQKPAFDQHYEPFVYGTEATDVTRATLAAMVTLAPTEPRKQHAVEAIRGIAHSVAIKSVFLERIVQHVTNRVATDEPEIRAVLSAFQGAGVVNAVTLDLGPTAWQMPPLLNRHLRITGIFGKLIS